MNPQEESCGVYIGVIGTDCSGYGDNQETLIVEWQTAGFSIRFPDPIFDNRTRHLVVVSAKGWIYAHLPHVGNPIGKRWDNLDFAERVESELSGLFRDWGENKARVTRND